MVADCRQGCDVAVRQCEVEVVRWRRASLDHLDEGGGGLRSFFGQVGTFEDGEGRVLLPFLHIVAFRR